MKYFIYLINCLLILAIPLIIITSATNEVAMINTELSVKKIKSVRLASVTETKTNENKEELVEEVVKEEPEEKVEETEKKLVVEEKKNTVSEEKKAVVEQKVETPPKPVEKPVVQEQRPTTDVLRTLTGTMSGYGPDCKGCGGRTKSGYDVRNTIYYPDSTYGNIRILAGDPSFAFGTIVRVKNSKLGNFIAIILDEGSGIGFGRSHLFDLLFPSELDAKAYGVSRNVTFEVLRNGY